MITWCRLPGILLAWVVLVGTVRCQASVDLAERFLKEGPARWEAYQSRVERLAGTVTGTLKEKGRVLTDTKYELKHNANARFCLRQPLTDTIGPLGKDQVFAYNPAYAFQLSRKTNNRPWVLTALEWQRRGESPPSIEETRGMAIQLRRLVQVFSDDLADLVRQPNFRVLRAQAVERAGVSLVELEFDNAHSLDQPGPFFGIQSGILWLDPERFWCLRACDLRSKHSDSDSRQRIETELRDPTADFPIPKRWLVTDEQTARPSGARHVFTWIKDYDLAEPAVLPPDQEFTLAAFGLPEPFDAQAAHGGPGWFIWVAAAGFGCLALGVLFAWLKRRAA